MSKALSEHDVQNKIRIELSKMGFCVFRVNVGKVKMADGRWFDTGLPKGFSDLMAIKDGRAYFIEVKTETGRVRPEQIRFIERMRELGCPAGIARSIDDAIKIVVEK